MDHTHLILEAEMGCSHLLSTMETASARDYCAWMINRFWEDIVWTTRNCCLGWPSYHWL